MSISVFLDLDGTLTNPEQGISRSIIHALRELNLPVPVPAPDGLRWAIGPALLDSFSRLGVADPQKALAL